MRKILLLMIWVCILTVPFLCMAKQENAYQFSFQKLNSEEVFSLSDFKGKAILVVNTASKCGYTKQFASLQKLYQEFHQLGLEIIGVPSGDFMGQEFGEEKKIATFCEVNYGVTFPMTKKSHVKGEKAIPFYQWARKELGKESAPKWNFHKYLIDTEGNLVNYFKTSVEPDSEEFVRAVRVLLPTEKKL